MSSTTGIASTCQIQTTCLVPKTKNKQERTTTGALPCRERSRAADECEEVTPGSSTGSEGRQKYLQTLFPLLNSDSYSTKCPLRFSINAADTNKEETMIIYFLDKLGKPYRKNQTAELEQKQMFIAKSKMKVNTNGELSLYTKINKLEQLM